MADCGCWKHEGFDDGVTNRCEVQRALSENAPLRAVAEAAKAYMRLQPKDCASRLAFEVQSDILGQDLLDKLDALYGAEPSPKSEEERK